MNYLKLGKSSIVSTAVLLSGVLTLGTAYAGAEFGTTTAVSNTVIYGTIGNTRNSADTVQYIYIDDRGSSITVNAKNSAGTTKSCATNSATMMATLRGITDGSRFYINHNNLGTCTIVRTFTGSVYQPKNH
jgi:hypothetical protein